MSEFKSRYKRAVDRLEPDSRLLESLKADMKAAAHAPPKPNFFVRYGWAFGSAAACLVVALAVGIMLSVGSREMASGGAMMNEAAYNGAAPDMVENAPYGMNGDIDDGGADGAANDIADGIVDDGAVPEPDEASSGAFTFNSTAGAEAAEDKSGSDTDWRAPEEAFSDVQNDIPMPHIEPQQITALAPLSYQELEVLLMMDQIGSGLILSDFALYDYIEVFNSNVYYLVLRYDTSGFTFPVVAAFQWVTSSDTVIALRLYMNYDDSSPYIDLREMSMADVEYYLLPVGYSYNFGDGEVYFGEKDIDRQLTPLTDEQFFELVNKADRGTLAISDFEELERFGMGYSYYTCTFVCTYTDSATEQGYVLITHFPNTEYDVAPDHLILRRRRSLKELDLLSDYDMLERFLG